ncbi:sigma-70 family RNA polymerase sigma factor [Actinacidiphila sp. DG2A-62]|uniref:sigma-70 family RNA polymerase sigma factor n=1 Tax=Actinacidiphila sp. DG2A-62 TaxID=3108821 RepID=UPI002DBBC87F|nr:sigma-70 family RNA polymerase sigma factor [Actinacidiphila sp. DG2A-62]MEC3992079.1 sigma-70 family RNA polymerase sigma factor [Actinacidiphila sp. DG2A-62]MEC3992117.1 sigma-70 family RNA polymerase sigma factor [Actinacidiphila sp. DG2A-62]
MNEYGLRGRRPRRTKIVVEDTQPLDFQAFHTLYRGDYVRWAELYLGSRADAEDAVDGAMLELLAQWAKVLEQAEPAAYAWWLVKNRVKDAARDRDRRQKMADAIFATRSLYENVVDPIGELETTMALWQAIDALPERQHDVALMRLALGRTTRETAGVLGITEATVRSTLRDARRRLAEALGYDLKKGHDDARNVD